MAIAPNTTFVSGAILTAAQQNAFGFSTVGLTTSTSLAQGGVTSIVDLTGMSVTFTAIANRNYKISAFMYAIPTVTNACASLSIREASTTLQTIITNLGVANVGTTMTGYVIKTFTAGSTTVKLSGALTTGSTGTINFTCAATLPVSILVEDIGPS